MLIGAHVSPAGGPAKAVERGQELGAQAIQIFNQSPRMWRPRYYGDDEVEDYGAPEGLEGPGAADPRRLPAQLRQLGQGDPRQVADLADRLAGSGREARRGRRRAASGQR